MDNDLFAIAIDGPSGAGKSTVARLVAKELNFLYIDTGAMYRAFALYFLKNDIDINNTQNVLKELDNINMQVEFKKNNQIIYLDNDDVSNLIRNEKISEMASKIACIPEVRTKLVKVQKKLAKSHSVVMDGRDAGSTVLPNAQIKIYLDANLEIRANRRMNELAKKEGACNYNEIKQNLHNRDEFDKGRKITPLIKTEDAIYIDSSDMKRDEVVKEIIGYYKNICYK
jgi:CMP/dCMP kinase